MGLLQADVGERVEAKLRRHLTEATDRVVTEWYVGLHAHPRTNPLLGEITFSFAYGKFTIMKNTRRKDGIRMAF